jgi:hypothetical protein
MSPGDVTPLVHDGDMRNAANTTDEANTSHATDIVDPAPEQLSLLPASEAPLRFRLDTHTRQLGLVQVAKMRALLHERIAARTSETSVDQIRRLRPPEVMRDRAA